MPPAAPAPRRLIVSADDFGLSPGVNAGVLAAHREGILTNASLMVNGKGFEDAVSIARQTPTLSVGLHLVLVQGRATLPPGEIPALADQDGMFRMDPVAAGMRYFFQPGLGAQLAREIEAQLEKFQATGLPLSHVDGHLNMHVHPTVLGILLQLAPRTGVRALRLPREPLAISLALDRRWLARKRVESMVFQRLSSYAAKRLAAAGLRYADQIFGLHQSGHMVEDHLLKLLATLPEGVTEIYTHASRVDAEARRWRPPDYESEAELAALTSARVRDALRQRNIELITYCDLAVARSAS